MTSERPDAGWPCPTIPTPWWKRTMDVSVSLTLLMLLSPVMATVALVTRLTMGGPVLFHQSRGGHGGRVFQLVKFRTMLDLNDDAGRPLPDAERTHWWGSFIRRTSLDELPSLVHVLRGEMSLVGPRPFLAVYLERYSKEQSRRHAVVPGITGLAQTRGRNFIDWDRKFELDLAYVDNQSFRTDLQILFETLRVVVSGSGADGVQYATEFMGNEVAEIATTTNDFVTTLELARTTLDLQPRTMPRFEAS